MGVDADGAIDRVRTLAKILLRDFEDAKDTEPGSRRWQTYRDCAAMHAEELSRAALALLSVDRPTISNADEWQLWLDEHKASGSAYLAVQIVEAIEEHQKALVREVYGLAEDAAVRFSDLASEDTPEGHYSRGAIAEAKSIARAINGIMPYSRDPGALAGGGRERLKGR